MSYYVVLFAAMPRELFPTIEGFLLSKAHVKRLHAGLNKGLFSWKSVTRSCT